jgi:phage-related protein
VKDLQDWREYTSFGILSVDKRLLWVGSSLRDLQGFPRGVQREVGFALRAAQRGERVEATRVLRGFHGAGVLEVLVDDDGSTYRAVYTVQFEEIVYVLHCFQKKSRRGAETPQHHKQVVSRRLRAAREDYEARRNIL